MSDTPTFYEDIVTEDVRVVTHYDSGSDRWTTTVIGGSIDGYSTTYRPDADPVVQHAQVIEAVRHA